MVQASDETATRHEPTVVEHYTLVPGGGRSDYREETVCVSCWIGCDDENCIEPHGNAPWPCEVARLRERVAALEAIADGAFDDVVRVVAGTAEYESAEWRVRLTLLLPKLSAALAQADDGGRA